ncbi:hypothetical protein BH708_17300 [Brachybacterium sp. P6-10-X1]|uniref:SDR family NAD(P)-dependent oxidoreductase n=1 Tax=Brachybacterium sp. P6-10-X1 TaxID=1903186 RepID=UPI0009718BDB|nr:SDR family NAD(P)-dependent oxidoreductase [Brachybacterium sp. P6-10-X1]APX34170.1 hypothetical protein BH708_17300 [Brachybacterium sp. P6-10-X1]
MTAMDWEHLPVPDLTGHTVVMTGASDGLGREAALQLALWGADLVLPVRSRSKGEVVAQRIIRETGRPDAVRLARLDLSDLSSVREGAEEIMRLIGPGGIDLLIHVAGVVTRRREETTDGFERMMAVNALAPLLLTETLLPLVRERVVVVASDAHTFGSIDLSDPPPSLCPRGPTSVPTVVVPCGAGRRSCDARRPPWTADWPGRSPPGHGPRRASHRPERRRPAGS